jgi:beta-lactamase regulating signal transducer with metallopeptidase domain
MVHLRRRDNITTAVHMLVEALFWFRSPVSWIERRLIDSGREFCPRRRRESPDRDYAVNRD